MDKILLDQPSQRVVGHNDFAHLVRGHRGDRLVKVSALTPSHLRHRVHSNGVLKIPGIRGRNRFGEVLHVGRIGIAPDEPVGLKS